MQAAASIALLLMSGLTQPGVAQQTNPPGQTTPSATQPAPPQAVQNDTTGQRGLPQAPAPKATEPLYLRDTGTDYTKPKSHLWNPLAPYKATNVGPPRLGNTPRLDQLLQDGKIYLSLSDAVTLANYRKTLRDRPSSSVLPDGLETCVHKLSGAAGVFDFQAVSRAASAVEGAIVERCAGRGAPGTVETSLDALLECIGRATTNSPTAVNTCRLPAGNYSAH